MSLFPNELQHLTLPAMAEAVLEWFGSHPQLRVSSQSRLLRQCRLIEGSKGTVVQNSHRDWRIFVQSLKDVQEYWFIIQTLGDRLVQSPFLDRFTRSLSDSTLPMDSGASTPGRDAQFELFLAAIAVRGGLAVDRLENAGADWIIASPAGRWSLEAKRIKNFENMEKHIRKAASQIIRSRLGGVIALDVSLVRNRNCEPLPVFLTDAEIGRWHKKDIDTFTKDNLRSIVEWIGPANVGFVLLHEFVIRPALATAPKRESWGLIELWGKVDLVTVDASRREHFDNLWCQLGGALPNLQGDSLGD